MNVFKVKKIQHGVTLLEMAVVIALLGIVMTTLFPTMQTLLSQISSLRGERFESYVSQSLATYYSNNVVSYVAVPGALPAAANISITLINPYATGGVDDLSSDFNNKEWNYAECSITDTLLPPSVPITLSYCSLVGYNTVGGGALTPGQLAALTTPQLWASSTDVESFVIFNGQHVVQRNLRETQKMVENVRNHLEDYYKNLVYSAEDQSYTINRFANSPSSADPAIDLLYDTNSDLANTVKEGDNLFAPNELEALGLTAGDVKTPFGGLITYDNAGALTRNPENGDSLPYTAIVWTNIISGAPSTQIEAIAVSKF